MSQSLQILPKAKNVDYSSGLEDYSMVWMHVCLIQTAVHLHLALYTLDWAQTAAALWGETLSKGPERPRICDSVHMSACMARVRMQMVGDVEMAAAVDEQRWDDEVGRAGRRGCFLTYKTRCPRGSWVSARYGVQQSCMRNSTKDPFVKVSLHPCMEITQRSSSGAWMYKKRHWNRQIYLIRGPLIKQAL